jgi:small GTP-binding protein
METSITYNLNNSSLDESKYSNKQNEFEKKIYDFKVILLGNSSVGKTSILERFISKKFSEFQRCTINVECKKKSILLDPTTSAELSIWDTAGEEKFRALTKNYYRDAQGILLLYDINDRKTFLDLNKWIIDIYEICKKEEISIILVGNKIDLERNVKKDEIIQFAEKYGFQQFEVSAKNGINIDLIFEKLAEEMVEKFENKEDNNDENEEKEEEEEKNEQNENETNKENVISIFPKIIENKKTNDEEIKETKINNITENKINSEVVKEFNKNNTNKNNNNNNKNENKNTIKNNKIKLETSQEIEKKIKIKKNNNKCC